MTIVGVKPYTEISAAFHNIDRIRLHEIETIRFNFNLIGYCFEHSIYIVVP